MAPSCQVWPDRSEHALPMRARFRSYRQAKFFVSLFPVALERIHTAHFQEVSKALRTGMGYGLTVRLPPRTQKTQDARDDRIFRDSQYG